MWLTLSDQNGGPLNLSLTWKLRRDNLLNYRYHLLIIIFHIYWVGILVSLDSDIIKRSGDDSVIYFLYLFSLSDLSLCTCNILTIVFL